MDRKLLGGALLLLVAGLALGPMQESDLFFRLKVGEEILRTGQLPDHNQLSFTHPEHPDLDPAWLFDVGAQVVFGIGGFRAVILAKAAVLLATFGAAFALCLRRGAGAAASALALGAAALVMQERMVERPHIMSFGGEVAVLCALAALDGPRPRRAYWLVPAVILWTNLHAGAFAAPVMVTLYAAGARLDRHSAARRALLLVLPCAAALFVSPLGVGLLRYLGLHLRIPALHPVDEFRTPTLISDGPLLAYGILVIGAAASAGRAMRWREVLPAAGLAFLAAGSVRFGADFALVSAPLLASSLSRLGPRLPATLRRPRLQAAAAGALLVGIAAGSRARADAPGAGLGLALDESLLPIEAIRFVEENQLRERMYNDFEIGSYLAWQGYPRYRVFIDPRLPAYPESFHRLLGRADLSRAEWDAALEELRVESALLSYAGINRRVAWWDPERWALVYRRHDARVFVRRLPRWQDLIAAREIPATFSFTVEAGTETHLLDPKPRLSPVSACEWQRRLGDLAFELDGQPSSRALAHHRRALEPQGCLGPPHEAATHAWLGAVELAAGNVEEALPSLDRALTLDPGDVSTRTNRALALEGLGRVGDARADWRRVAEQARGTPLGQKAAARAR